MIGMVRSLMATLKTGFRKPVTVQYPDEHLPMSPRFLGFPALLWNDKVGEPQCTGCQVCARYCPTECMMVTMKDNPLFKEGKSKHRKVVDSFEIRSERCILCGICVEVCSSFKAIVMSDYHEQADPSRASLILNLEELLRRGKDVQQRKGLVVGDAEGEDEKA